MEAVCATVYSTKSCEFFLPVVLPIIGRITSSRAKPSPSGLILGTPTFKFKRYVKEKAKLRPKVLNIIPEVMLQVASLSIIRTCIF